jgi:hypothetical protein
LQHFSGSFRAAGNTAPRNGLILGDIVYNLNENGRSREGCAHASADKDDQAQAARFARDQAAVRRI